MGLETTVPWVTCQEFDGLFDRTVAFFLGGITLEKLVGLLSFPCPL